MSSACSGKERREDKEQNTEGTWRRTQLGAPAGWQAFLLRSHVLRYCLSVTSQAPSACPHNLELLLSNNALRASGEEWSVNLIRFHNIITLFSLTLKKTSIQFLLEYFESHAMINNQQPKNCSFNLSKTTNSFLTVIVIYWHDLRPARQCRSGP